MCGLAGSIFLKKSYKKVANNFTKNAINEIIYRGPDSNQIESLENACLGSCRLSINDTRSIANMPMKSNCLRYTLVFNGEVYNYKELRKDLVNEFNFKTNSDTEVVLNSFIKYGTKCFDKFEGMFAIAIWDNLDKKLFLARDRLGKKPLHYYLDKNIFYFCSEFKPLSKIVKNESVLNNKFLEEITLFGDQSINETVNKKIFRIVPNTYNVVSFSKSYIKLESHFYSSIFEVGNYKNDSKSNLYDSLLEAVSLRLSADRPLAIALSGGLDSAVLCKIISESGYSKPPAFTIRFNKKDEEVKRAEIIAKKYQLDHHIIDYKHDERDFFEIIKFTGEPYCDPGLAYLSYICTKLPKDIKVLLTGDGGDEAFLGYSRYKYSNFYNELPYLIKNLSDLINNKNFKSNNFFTRFIFNRLHILKVYSSKNMKDLENNTLSFLKPFISKETFLSFNGIVEERSNRTRLKKPLYQLYKKYCIHDIANKLPGRYLPKIDLAGAFNGIEIRSPYLDDRLFSLALKNMTRGNSSLLGKPFLKNLLLEDFPKSFLKKRKMGFSPRQFVIPQKSAFKSLISIKSKDLSYEINEIANAFLSNPVLLRNWYSKSIIWNLMCIDAWYSA